MQHEPWALWSQLFRSPDISQTLDNGQDASGVGNTDLGSPMTSVPATGIGQLKRFRNPERFSRAHFGQSRK